MKPLNQKRIVSFVERNKQTNKQTNVVTSYYR